ncbi:MAG: protein-L-isoaspartate(D-aspartate) O-methyltransferase [Planctomycetota bacterium]|jgi:protein-L-isoaspartate(D-aspartate) O-methyltransferase
MLDFIYHRRRRELVELLEQKGITDEKVLEAIGKIPRHQFIPDTALHIHAYENKAFPIGADQTISHPYTVAFQSQKLEIKKGDKVLEIGTGSGYQAAVLAELGAKVYSIERQKKLYDRTAPFLRKLGYKMHLYYGDGFLGKPVFAPYDKIIITAAAPEIPKALLEQLKIGGYLIIPLDNDKGSQDMLRIIKHYDEETKKYSYEKQQFETFSFVPMLKGEHL